MDVPSASEQGVMVGTRIRLRTDVYDRLVAERGATAVGDQVEVTGVPRKTLYRIRHGREPSMATAVRICSALGARFEELFEPVEDAE